MIFDGTLATKILMSFENHIETVEKWVDKVVHAVCSVYNLVYFPAFIFFIKKLDFIVNSASKDQLKILEDIIKTFRMNIRKLKTVPTPLKPELSPRNPLYPSKKKSVVNTRSTSQAS